MKAKLNITITIIISVLLAITTKAISQTSNTIYISEFSASNKKVLFDEDGESSDWIEIYNPTKQSVNILNWSLTDDSLNLYKWIFPDVDIKAGELLVVFASQKDRKILGQNLHTNFRLSSKGEYLALVNNSGEIVSEFRPSFPSQYEDISYGVFQHADTINLISKENAGVVFIPTESDWNEIQMTWTGLPANEPFNTEKWTPALAAIGFDKRNTPGQVNLALGKPTKQSSNYNNGSFPSSNGTDGNINNFTHTADGDYSPWWEVDIEQSSFINQIIIHNRKNCCQERLYNIVIEIRDGEDNLLFKSEPLNPFAEGESPTSPGSLIKFNFESLPGNGIAGQKIRISKESVSGAREYLSLAEVEIFGIDSYQNSEILTDISELYGKQAIAIARFEFDVENIDKINYARLKMKYDDGFIAYINGIEVASSNKPESDLTHLSNASQLHYATNEEEFIISTDVLKEKGNVLALVGLNITKDDQSFLIQANLSAFEINTTGYGYFTNPTPGKINNKGVDGFVADTKFDIDRGFFDEGFTLTITSKTPGASIVYTLDGSEPAIGNGEQVLPANDNTIPLARINISKTTILRAAAFKEGLKSTNTDTQSYIFLDDIITSEVMDRKITTDTRYRQYMKKALTGIPTLSLVIAPGTIEDEVDRKASLEWIQNGTEEGFQVNCGARYYGGEWAGPFAKQNFRIYFRKRYGVSKLKYPLFNGFDFGIPAENTFDQLEIRAGSHDMVQRGFYMSNRFCDDTMLEMGNLNTHGRFVHLYFNGVYWGMYHLRERFNADWLSQYAGGSKNDYEAISGNKNIGGWTTTDRVYDGEGIAWEKSKSLREDYESIKEYVDMQSYIDFMLLYMFGNSENEYRTAGSTIPGVGFQFQLNDADGFLRDSGNRTNMGQPGQKHADGPGSIFSMLLKEGHPAYKMLLADRIHKHFFNNGALTSERIADRLGKRCNEVKIPFYAEAARWGYRTPDSWENAKNNYFTSVIPFRPQTVIQQFKDAGFYPDLFAPTFFINNQERYGGNFVRGDELSIFSEEGNIYYTLNGDDPYSPIKLDHSFDTLIDRNTDLKVLTLSGDIPVNWSSLNFNDGAWTTGKGGVGYETNSGYEQEISTDVKQMKGEATGCLIRIPFNVSSKTITKAHKLVLRIKYDDGFIAYLNGIEVKRVNFTGEPKSNSTASESREASNFKEFDLTSFKNKLNEGDNLLAIHGLNITAESSDFLISARLEIKTITTLEEELSPNAKLYEASSISLDTTVVVNSRTYKDGIWSALSQAKFVKTISSGVLEEELSVTKELEVKCFPNPFDNKVSFQFKSPVTTNVTMRICNVEGKMIWYKSALIEADQTNVFQLTTDKWERGLYIYHLNTEEGRTRTGKIIRL